MVDSPTMKRSSAVSDVKPLDLYDWTKAKICASVGWLLAKSYGCTENVPAELRDPFYCDQYEQEHLKPPVTRLLQSSELYCRTYGLLFERPESGEQPKDNAALVHLLSQRGLLSKDQETAVSEAALQQKPIKMSSHLAVIDALMAVAAMETVAAVRTGPSADLLGGGSWEDALLHWVNVLNQKLRESNKEAQTDTPQAVTEPESVQPSCPTRWYWKLVPLRYRKDKMQSRQKPIFPVVNEVKDLSSGCAIAAVIHYYCPGLLRLEDVCMKESMSAADCLYNLQFIREFCDSCLKSCCHLALEDILYIPQELQINLLSFLAELLCWFEVKRPEFVQPVDTLAGCSPVTPSGNSTSPSIFKKPFLPISSNASGSLTQSTSMSHIEGAGQTWSKKSRSRPLSAISFSIPFGLDSDVDIVMGDPVITRSVSSDHLNPAGHNTNHMSFTPHEDPSLLRTKSPAVSTPQRASWTTQSHGIPRVAEENGVTTSETGELPTIEEALQIIHNESKLEPRLHPDGAPDGFYLHSPDDPASSRNNSTKLAPISASAPSHSGMIYRPIGDSRETSRTRNASECSRDDDSVLRDGSVDSDASEDMPKSQSTPVSGAHSARGPRKDADSGVKMTSFAERKKKQMDSPKASESPSPETTTWTQKTEESPSNSPELNDMSELGVRLEEKRRAIEAQKKRIEAIFAKHRQRLGKSAFRQLKKEQLDDDAGEEGRGDVLLSTSSTEENLSRLSLEEKQAQMEEDDKREECEQRLSVEDDVNVKERLEPNYQGGNFNEKLSREKDSGTAGQKIAPLGDYNNAVSKLTAALSSLQSDMQRLTEQQNHLLTKKPAALTSKSWVIPASPRASTAASTPVRTSREPTRNLNSTSTSPSPSHKITTPTTPKSPQVQRRARSVPPKSPKHHQHARPLDVKPPTYSRVITAPQNVDSIPHLRRVNPWQSQVQTSSSFTIGDSDTLNERSSRVTPTSTPAQTPVPPDTTPHPAADDTMSDIGSNDGHSIFNMELEAGASPGISSKKERPAGGGCSSGAPSECSFESDVPVGPLNGKRSSLIEISLSSLRGDGEEEEQGPDPFSDAMSDRTDPDTRAGVGFFFRDDKERPEDEMAQRKAAFLEKQQKRAEEMKRRKLEQEKESNKPQWMTIEGWGNRSEDRPGTPGTPPAPGTPSGDGTPQRRGDFTRQEYERRQQLKIMEDLDKVLRQKPTTVRGVKKQRPKTVFRDDSSLSHSPIKGLIGPRLNKVYSHSTMNLSSMTNDSGGLTIRKSPSRSHSPSRFMSPRRMSGQNGEKDWENGSTISSPASIPEYTGPKLYKEPSFKSNKFIIHNAITRCCLAGKVNEPQKNKIVEEMEKSAANHFLILFRDASCQFRAVYTMNPETEEMVRLTGIGPRIILPENIESIYKYSSDRKQFTVIPSKTMSMSVDAFTIPSHFWQKRPGTPKKLGTPK